jgi:hypothetical protein
MMPLISFKDLISYPSVLFLKVISLLKQSAITVLLLSILSARIILDN